VLEQWSCCLLAVAGALAYRGSVILFDLAYP
jgi:hypothetical protein